MTKAIGWSYSSVAAALFQRKLPRQFEGINLEQHQLLIVRTSETGDYRRRDVREPASFSLQEK